MSFQSSLADTLTAMFCRKGSFFEGQDELFRPQFAFEVNSGQWVSAMRGRRLLGWLSYYLVSERVMEYLRDYGLLDAIRVGRFFEFRRGDCIYLSSGVVAEDAPRWLLSSMGTLVIRRQPRARFVCAHLNNRGQSRFWIRPVGRAL